MNPEIRQYLFGALFLGVAGYQLYLKDHIEAALYALAGIAFIVNALASAPRLLAYRKPLVIITWVLIIVTGILFLYLLQFKYL